MAKQWHAVAQITNEPHVNVFASECERESFASAISCGDRPKCWSPWTVFDFTRASHVDEQLCCGTLPLLQLPTIDAQAFPGAVPDVAIVIKHKPPQSTFQQFLKCTEGSFLLYKRHMKSYACSSGPSASTLTMKQHEISNC